MDSKNLRLAIEGSIRWESVAAAEKMEGCACREHAREEGVVAVGALRRLAIHLQNLGALSSGDLQELADLCMRERDKLRGERDRPLPVADVQELGGSD